MARQHLTVSLLHREYSDPDDAIEPRTLGSLERIALRRSLPFRAVLYVERQHRREPRWVPFVSSGLSQPLVGLRNSAVSAVLVLNAADHLFALSFGHGRHFLRDDRIERDFGLRVVLNVVDPTSLRSVDMRTLDETRLMTSRQASRSASLDVFGIDVSRDILRAVTGKPREAQLAAQVAGADRLSFSAEVSIEQLGEKCAALLAAYSSDAYKEQFGWIDNLRVVRDRVLAATLDDELVTHIREEDFTRVQLAAPEPINWEVAGGYRHSVEGRYGPLYGELDIAEYVAAARERRGEAPELARLKSDSVLVASAATAEPIQKWSVYRGLNFDVRLGDSRYALTDGEWYEIDAAFAADVTAQVAAFGDSDLWFPDLNKGEREDAYLARAAPEMTTAANYHFAVMDRKLVRAAGARTEVEMCDLLSQLAHFIHVKKGDESAMLSHLFAQGVVSAELFVADAQFRTQARAHVAGTPCDSDDVFPPIVPRNHVTVVYAIADRRLGPLSETLPFFSLVNLTNASRRLQALGCELEVKHVSVT